MATTPLSYNKTLGLFCAESITKATGREVDISVSHGLVFRNIAF